MRNAKKTVWIVLGVLSAALLLGAVWYSCAYNAGRLVYPMDFSAYRYRPQDLPMILGIAAVTLYIFALCAALVARVIKNRKTPASRTRSLNPKLGLLGFAGLLGFLGFWTYNMDKSIFPFCFFVFFGFFGFFYEGKMSGTFVDERFRENARRAQLAAMRLGFALIWVAMLVVGQGRLLGNLEYTAIFLTIAVSLALGLVLFLSEYLLYRYDHDEPGEE